MDCGMDEPDHDSKDTRPCNKVDAEDQSCTIMQDSVGGNNISQRDTKRLVKVINAVLLKLRTNLC